MSVAAIQARTRNFSTPQSQTEDEPIPPPAFDHLNFYQGGTLPDIADTEARHHMLHLLSTTRVVFALHIKSGLQMPQGWIDQLEQCKSAFAPHFDFIHLDTGHSSSSAMVYIDGDFERFMTMHHDAHVCTTAEELFSRIDIIMNELPPSVTSIRQDTKRDLQDVMPDDLPSSIIVTLPLLKPLATPRKHDVAQDILNQWGRTEASTRKAENAERLRAIQRSVQLDDDV